MNRRLIIAAGIMTLCTACKKKKQETVTPVISPITEAVFAPGHIEAQGQFTLTAINDGYITRIKVQEGDMVAEGQTLFEQDNSNTSVQQQVATENLHIARQQAANNSAIMQQLQAQLNTANDKLQNDKIQLERMERLYATRSVAKIELDNARLIYNNSLNNVISIRQNMAATKLTLQQGVINSRGQQQTAILSNNYYNIKSPGEYKVYSVLKKKGDLLRKGEAVAVLGDATTMSIVLTIDEASIGKIELYQKVLVELNTKKGETYTGYVSKIYPAFDVGTQAYTIEASFDNMPPGIINGTLLQANIIIAQKDKAMLIPRNCISPDGKAWIKKEGKTDTVSVRTGIISNEWVEILYGLDKSDEIIKQF